MRFYISVCTSCWSSKFIKLYTYILPNNFKSHGIYISICYGENNWKTKDEKRRIGELTISKTKGKVEKILKGNLDLIPSPSPSVKIQIMGGKVCLRCKGKRLLGVVNKLLKVKSFAFTPQANFPAHILNFYYKRWRWLDWMQAVFLIFFTLFLFANNWWVEGILLYRLFDTRKVWHTYFSFKIFSSKVG